MKYCEIIGTIMTIFVFHILAFATDEYNFCNSAIKLILFHRRSTSPRPIFEWVNTVKSVGPTVLYKTSCHASKIFPFGQNGVHKMSTLPSPAPSVVTNDTKMHLRHGAVHKSPPTQITKLKSGEGEEQWDFFSYSANILTMITV